MKWLRCRHAGLAVYGTLEGDEVVLHDGTPFGEHRPNGHRLPVDGLAWLTPSEPRTIVGLWNNFHALADKNGWAAPAEPLYFLKAAGSAAAHREPIRPPLHHDGRIAYEGELAVVIGRTARAVSVADAPAHILGYSCANDVTAMELIARDPTFPQWVRAKSFDTFGVFGPVIDTAFDPAAAWLRTRVNGRERQAYPLSDMFFAPAEIVSRVSHDLTLHPGDVILCGTSLGVMPMKPGTTVEVEIDGLGTLVNTFG